MLAPYGVLQALSRLSLPVLTNHLPQLANLSDSTQLSWRCSWYLSGFDWCITSTLLLSMLTTTTQRTSVRPGSHWHEICQARFTLARVWEGRGSRSQGQIKVTSKIQHRHKHQFAVVYWGNSYTPTEPVLLWTAANGIDAKLQTRVY